MELKEERIETGKNNVPNFSKVEAFPPVDSERFALKLFFDNGECRKYVLPIKRENEKDEKVSFRGYEFTDKIWQSAVITDDLFSQTDNNKNTIKFENGFLLSSKLCYSEGIDYSEPELTDDIIYEDEKCILKRIWKWDVDSVKWTNNLVMANKNNDFESKTMTIPDLLVAIRGFDGFRFWEKSISTFINIEGKRLCSLDFDNLDNCFCEGYTTIGKNGYGFGIIDRNMNIVISMKYDEINQFIDGFVRVRKGNNYYQIDKQGKEKFIYSNEIFEKYQEVGEFCDGMCRVSILNLEGKLAYYSDSEFIAGICGYLNKEGKEVIPPQYIYANDFENGIAIVCKGKWTKDEKWGNKDKYWTETEHWGAIDKNGNEVIPFIYDDIVSLDDYNEIFKAHYGGWEKGNWGVIDRSGKWLAEPVFEDIYGDCVDGLIVFCNYNRFDNDDALIGIYDIKNKKVLFEPQFSDADIFENGEIIADYFDKKLNKRIERIFDRNGKELFYSDYSFIIHSRHKDTYVVAKDNIANRGLVNKKGRVLFPCGYNNLRFHYKEKLIEFSENNKVGLKDFDGNIIIPPQYTVISNIGDVFYTVQTGVNEKSKVGLITPNGKIVVPLEFRRIDWLRDDKHIVCCRDGFCQMLEYIEK